MNSQANFKNLPHFKRQRGQSNKSLKAAQKAWLVVRSSLIIANHFAPLTRALCSIRLYPCFSVCYTPYLVSVTNADK